MSALNLSQQHKVKRQLGKAAQQCEREDHDDLLESFPLPKYFQVHFQQIHERTDDVHQELAAIKEYVDRLETKLDLLIKLLTQYQGE